MKISFLIHNIYGIGGTNRTVLNLAEALADRHDVEIASVLRRQDHPQFAIPSGITLVPLVDLRIGQPDRADPRLLKRSALIPPSEEFFRYYNTLTDERITHYLAATNADVVIGTRPGLALCVARLARQGALRVAQEHMTQDMIDFGSRREMLAHYGRLDASVSITESDAQALREGTPVAGLRVLTIPNSVPEPDLPPSDGSTKIVMAAGRIDPVKRHDLLVHAFARVAAARPDWSLRIYGSGPALDDLRALVLNLGLYNNVFLMGRRPQIGLEWAKASIAAVASDKESFGMTIVEAMRCGVPVVSTDCPVGPAEIIQPGVDGLLVPVDDADAMAAALLELIDDPDRRRQMGKAALDNSRRFDPAVIADAYERLFDELGAARRAATGDRRPVRRGGGLRASVRRLPRPRWPWDRGRHGGDGARTGRTTVQADAALVITLEGPSGVGHRIRALVCRDREGVRLVRVEFAPPRQPHQRRTAILPACGPGGTPTLPEGRWDVFVEDASGNLRRLRDGGTDVRGLLTGQSAGPVIRNVPYPTKDGFLAIRSWVRDPHAETGAITFGETSINVAGRLLGATFDGRTPTLLLVRRQEPALTLTVLGVSPDGADFAFEVGIRDMVAKRVTWQDDWDLWLAGPAGAPAIRLARLLDDVHERKPVFRYPAIRATEQYPDLTDEHPRPKVRVRPFYTTHNELSLYLTEA